MLELCSIQLYFEECVKMFDTGFKNILKEFIDCLNKRPMGTSTTFINCTNSG